MWRVRIRYTKYGNNVIAHSGRLVPASTLLASEFIDVPRKIGRSFSIAHHENNNALHISKLYVQRKRRRGGVAGNLLKNWVRYAKKNKYKKLLIDVGSENEGMLKFMAKLPEWRLIKKYHKNYVGMLTFVLRLK